MTVVEIVTPDLPVAWWVFWLVVMVVVVFVALAWWLTRAALAEDAASPPGRTEDLMDLPRNEPGEDGSTR